MTRWTSPLCLSCPHRRRMRLPIVQGRKLHLLALCRARIEARVAGGCVGSYQCPLGWVRYRTLVPCPLQRLSAARAGRGPVPSQGPVRTTTVESSSRMCTCSPSVCFMRTTLTTRHLSGKGAPCSPVRASSPAQPALLAPRFYSQPLCRVCLSGTVSSGPWLGW